MELFSYQEEGVKTLLNLLIKNPAKSVYLADQMGLGKSAQALSVVNSFTHDTPLKTLIICPAIMRLTWAKEIRNWCKAKSSIKVLTSVKEAAGLKNQQDFTIMSYDTAQKDVICKEIKKLHYDFLILDEAHKIQYLKTLRSKQILSHIWHRCKYRICLSGTPATSSLLGLFPLFHMCSPSDFPSYWDFAATYLYKVENFFGVKYEGAKNLAQLSALIRSKFFLRRLKEDVLTDLPNKVFKEVTLPATTALSPDSQTKEYLLKILEGHTAIYPAHFAAWRQAQGSLKVTAIAEYVKELLEQGSPVVLFCYHIDIVEAYKKSLAKFNPVVITGGTNSKDKAVDAFQSGTTNLLIATLGAAGLGITLTRSSDVVLAELSYVPAEIDQAIDRCHRIGQKNSVTVHYFVASGSEIEESISNILVKKINILSKALD